MKACDHAATGRNIEISQYRLCGNNWPGGNIEDIYPLSPIQEGILFHTIYSPNSEQYFVQTCLFFTGEFNNLSFKLSFEKIIEKNTIFRTCFNWNLFTTFYQIVLKNVKLPWSANPSLFVSFFPFLSAFCI